MIAEITMQPVTRAGAAACTWTFLALTGLLAVSAAPRAQAAVDEYFKSYKVSPHPLVRVSTDDGSVRVTTSDTSQVEFHAQYAGSDWGIMLGGPPRIESRQEGNTVELNLHVNPSMLIGFSNRRVHIDVSMPRNADLDLQTDDGRVELSSVNGDIRVHTADGAIKAAQLSGTIDLHTNDGSITVDTLAGDVRLHSSDGAIRAANLAGRCQVSSSDGSIQVSGRFDLLDARSDDGSIVARAEPGSRATSSWMLHTSDGSVRLSLPKDFKATLDASTDDGDIRSELPVQVQGELGHKHIQGAMNGGGAPLIIHTDEGSIELDAT